MSIRSLISKATAKKTTKSNKRGAMLIMTLLVLMFALIFCMSAIMLTTWTRDRYYDSAVSEQAHLTVTAYAEAIYQAISIQQISDETVKSLADANATVNFSSVALPGGLASPDSNTVAKFSKDPSAQPDGSWYYYIDVTTTILDEVESVRIYLKLPPPPSNNNLFTNTIELADGGNLGQMNLGMNAGDNDDNTVLLHGNSDIADGGGTNIYSNVITTGVITGGSGNHYYGDLVFFGPDAGYNYQSQDGDGIRGESNVYFITPDSSSSYWALTGQTYRMGNAIFDDAGNPATASRPAGNHNFYADFVYFMNTNLNAYSLEGLATYANADHVGNIFSGGPQSPQPYFEGCDAHGGPGSGSAFYRVAENALTTYADLSVSGVDEPLVIAAAGVNDYLTEDMIQSVVEETPTSDEARGMFGVPAYPPADSISVSTFRTGEWEPGNYIVGTATMGRFNTGDNPVITIDLSKGSVTLYVTNSFTISNGYFNVINGVGSENRFTIVLADGAQLNIGEDCGYGEGMGYIGIVSSVHTNPLASSPADPNFIPHAYIFGADRNIVTINQNRTCDAYIGLYGSVAEVVFKNEPYFHGRIEASTISYGHGSPARIDYCMGPNAEEGNGDPVPVSTDFIVERFYYYHGDTPAV